MKKWFWVSLLLLGPILFSGCAGGGGGGGLSSSGSPASGLGPSSNLSNSLRLTVSWPQGKALPASATAILVNVVDLEMWEPQQGRPEIVNPQAIKAKAQAARQGASQTIVVTGVPTGFFWIDVTALDASGNRVAGAYTVMRITDAGAELSMEVFPKIFYGGVASIRRHDSWQGDGSPLSYLRIEAVYASPEYQLVNPPPGVGIEGLLNGGFVGSLPGPNHEDSDSSGNKILVYGIEPVNWNTGTYVIRPFGAIPSDYSNQAVSVAFEGRSIEPTTFVSVTDGVNSHPSALDSTRAITATWNPVAGAVRYRLVVSGGGGPGGGASGGQGSFYWRSRDLTGTSFTIPGNTLPGGMAGLSMWVEAERLGAESMGQKINLTLGGSVSVTVNRDSQEGR